LERLAAVLQDVHSNYEIDLFAELIRDIAKITNTEDLENNSLRVIADHIRSCAFLVVDGVVPSNEGRGYVLRRIVRRAVRHGYRLGVKEVFFYKIVASLARAMGEAYPELYQKQEFVERILMEEERQFARTLENGMAILEKAITELQGDVIAGGTVFKLYDTYGFPVDLTADIAREHNLVLDMDGFEAAMNVQREQARAASHFTAVDKLILEDLAATAFTWLHQPSGRW
jgi:alanyl-tRNA synthetase